MEDVLAVYQQPPAPTTPLVCMDERPVQLVNVAAHVKVRKSEPVSRLVTGASVSPSVVSG